MSLSRRGQGRSPTGWTVRHRRKMLLAAMTAAITIGASNLAPVAATAATFLPLPPATTAGSTTTSPPLPAGPATTSKTSPTVLAPPTISPLTTPAPGTAPPETTKASGPDPTSAAAGLVEDTSKRTVNSKTFATATPGHFTTHIYEAPIHFKDASGTWADIDPTLTTNPTKGDHRSAKANSFGIDVATQASDANLMAVNLDADHQISWSLDAAAAPAPAVVIPAKLPAGAPTAFASSVAEFAEAAPGVSVKVKSSATEASTDLVLASAAVPTTYRFALHLKGLSAALEAASGDVIYTDSTGAVRARTNPAVMTDSKIDPRTGSGASTPARFSLVPDGTGTTLVVSLDRAWLANPARVFPVVVDPNVQPQSGIDDTYNDTAVTGDNSASAFLRVGNYVPGHTDRAFLHFPGLDSLNGYTINSAQFLLFNDYAPTCSPTPMSILRVTSPWNGPGITSFATPPSPQIDAAHPLVTASFAHGFNAACPAQYQILDATTAVQNWANGTWPNDGIALLSATNPENNPAAFKSFHAENSSVNVPLIGVDYTVPFPPSAPQAVSATATNGTATVTWSPPASNGGSYGIALYQVQGTNLTTGGSGPFFTACGTCLSATLVVSNGNSYNFVVVAENSAASMGRPRRRRTPSPLCLPPARRAR